MWCPKDRRFNVGVQSRMVGRMGRAVIWRFERGPAPGGSAQPGRPRGWWRLKGRCRGGPAPVRVRGVATGRNRRGKRLPARPLVERGAKHPHRLPTAGQRSGKTCILGASSTRPWACFHRHGRATSRTDRLTASGISLSLLAWALGQTGSIHQRVAPSGGHARAVTAARSEALGARTP